MNERPSAIRPILFALALGSAFCAWMWVVDYLHGEFEPKHETRIVYAQLPTAK